MAVHEAGVGRVQHLEAGLPHAVAPVHVLEVEEEAFVHGAGAVHGRAAHQQAAAQDPVHRPAGLVVEVLHQVQADGLAVGKDPAQEGAAQQQGPEGVEAAAGILDRTVLVQQLGPDHARPRVGVGEVQQAVQGAGLDHDVRIQDQVVLGLDLRPCPGCSPGRSPRSPC